MSCANMLKDKGLKLTPQRRAILDIIHDNDSHLTAEKIITYVKNRMPGVHKSTIYRTLEILEQTGCVFKSELDNQFIYHHSDEGHHHHLVCRNCGTTIDCDEDIFAPVEKMLMEKYKFNVNFTHIVMNGLCKKCRNKIT